MLIDPRRAAFQLRGHLSAARRVIGPYGTAQPVVSRVRAADRVIDVLVRNYWQRRAELFFVDEPHAVGNISDDCRREEVTFLADARAAGNNLGAVLFRVLN